MGDVTRRSFNWKNAASQSDDQCHVWPFSVSFTKGATIAAKILTNRL